MYNNSHDHKLIDIYNKHCSRITVVIYVCLLCCNTKVTREPLKTTSISTSVIRGDKGTTLFYARLLLLLTWGVTLNYKVSLLFTQ